MLTLKSVQITTCLSVRVAGEAVAGHRAVYVLQVKLLLDIELSVCVLQVKLLLDIELSVCVLQVKLLLDIELSLCVLQVKLLLDIELSVCVAGEAVAGHRALCACCR